MIFFNEEHDENAYISFVTMPSLIATVSISEHEENKEFLIDVIAFLIPTDGHP